MRWLINCVVFLLVLNIVNAQDFNDYKSLGIQSKFNSNLELEYLEPNYKIDYVNTNLTFFPRKNEFQSVNYKLNSNPEADTELNENFISYSWKNPKDKEIRYGLTSDIKTELNFKKIKGKIKFPIEDVESLSAYTRESETVTSKDPEIIKKAAELAQGEDDLYVVVHKIGSWTKENINYSLETLTMDVSQNASWVFENKRGVCDELTSLFIAMLRSINIPARFVTGQAYTNVINGFGNHAWAEVYFPSYGWVAFDPTYGQFGYVDATHITMRDSLDIKEPSVNYAWRSYGVEVKSNKPDITTNITSLGEIYKENVELNSKLFEEEAGPGSYIPLEVNIKNPNDYYLPLTLYLTKAPKDINEREKNILLKPLESKKVFFIIEVPKNVDNGFIYISKIEVTDSFENKVSTNIKFGQEYNIYTLDEALKKVSQFTEEDKKIYSANIDLNCKKDRGYYYKYDVINLNCYVKNIGNVNLQDLNLCYINYCQKINLNINEEKKFNISLMAKDFDKELLIKINNDDVNKNLFVDLNILKDPGLNIKNLSYPKIVDYNNFYNLTFNMNSNSEIKNVRIKIGSDKLFNLKAFKGENEFNVNFKGKNFNKKLNLTISYEDLNGKKYELQQPIELKVENAPSYLDYYWIIILILIVIISMILRKKRH